MTSGGIGYTRVRRRTRKRRKITVRCCCCPHPPTQWRYGGGVRNNPNKTKQGQGWSPADNDIKDGREEKDKGAPSASSAKTEQRRASTTQRTWRTWRTLTTTTTRKRKWCSDASFLLVLPSNAEVKDGEIQQHEGTDGDKDSNEAGEDKNDWWRWSILIHLKTDVDALC